MRLRLLACILIWSAVMPAQAGDTGRCGGTGGNREIALSCPVGYHIVGIGARGGAFVDSVSIRCGKFDENGVRSQRLDWQTGGADGGTNFRDAQCPSDMGLTEIAVSSGGYLDKVKRGICRKRKPRGGFGGTEGKVVEVIPLGSKGIGGVGGVACQLTCPAGEALHEIIVKYGGWVDSIRGKCRS